VGLSYLQSSHMDIFLTNPIIVFFLLRYDKFFFLSWWACQASGPVAAAPSAPWLIRLWVCHSSASRLFVRLCLRLPGGSCSEERRERTTGRDVAHLRADGQHLVDVNRPQAHGDGHPRDAARPRRRHLVPPCRRGPSRQAGTRLQPSTGTTEAGTGQLQQRRVAEEATGGTAEGDHHQAGWGRVDQGRQEAGR